MRNVMAAVGAVALLVLLTGAMVLWAGLYNVAADSGPGFPDGIARFTREHSIDFRAGSVGVPPFDPVMVAAGAAHYDEMCTGCHLAPGMTDSELRAGLNPKPPVLARRRHPNPQEDFWIVKHGIRMTAMPAWGATHSDKQLWDIVAFLRQLPGMSAGQYHAMVGRGKVEATPAVHLPGG